MIIANSAYMGIRERGFSLSASIDRKTEGVQENSFLHLELQFFENLTCKLDLLKLIIFSIIFFPKNRYWF